MPLSKASMTGPVGDNPSSIPIRMLPIARDNPRQHALRVDRIGRLVAGQAFQPVPPGHPAFDAILHHGRYAIGLVETAGQHADIGIVGIVENQRRTTIATEAAPGHAR